jgi:hypothetical protein
MNYSFFPNKKLRQLVYTPAEKNASINPHSFRALHKQHPDKKIHEGQ